MTYYALLPFPSYLEQYCRFHGGSMTLPDGSEVIDIGFIPAVVDRISSSLVPYADIEAAMASDVWHEDGEPCGSRPERWVRVGSSKIRPRQVKGPSRGQCIYLIPKGCHKYILSAAKDSFIFQLVRGWTKAMAQASKTGTVEEQSSYINFFLSSNGISMNDSDYQAVSKLLRRYLSAAGSIRK